MRAKPQQQPAQNGLNLFMPNKADKIKLLQEKEKELLAQLAEVQKQINELTPDSSVKNKI